MKLRKKYIRTRDIKNINEEKINNDVINHEDYDRALIEKDSDEC